MNKTRCMRGIAAVLCLVLVTGVLMIFPSAKHTAYGASLKDLQATLQNLKEQQAALDQKLATLKNEAQSQIAYRDSLNEKIKNAQEQIDNLNTQIQAYDAQIIEKEAEIAETESQIDRDYETLKRRLKLLYLMGEASLLDIVLSAESVQDYFNKAEFVTAIVQHDNDVIESLKNANESIKSEKESIEADRAAVAQARAEYDKQKAELEAAMAESKRVTAKLEADAAKAEAQQAELERKYAEADKAIEAWWVAYYKRQEELKKQQELLQQQQQQIVGTGTFMWPMPGYASKRNISAYFGAGRGHRGVDIAGGNIYGKGFVAADSGKVVYVSYGDPIYGIYCMIDHGNGISTLYGHCSGLAVKVGQTVTKGQTIGYVGQSGIASGPHLHFGVLKNGVAINPMQYFNIG